MLTLRISQTTKTVRSFRQSGVFETSNHRPSSGERLAAGGRPGNRCPWHEPHNSSALHTYVWKWFWFMGLVRSRNWWVGRPRCRFTRPCAGGGWWLSRLGHPDTDWAFIYTSTLRKVCYCLLNALTAVCRRFMPASWAGLTLFADVGNIRPLERRKPHHGAPTNWWYQSRFPKQGSLK